MNLALVFAETWQRFIAVIFSGDVILFAGLAVAVVLAFHIVAVLWDATRGGDDDATP